jgi:hypothetical protein
LTSLAPMGYTLWLHVFSPNEKMDPPGLPKQDRRSTHLWVSTVQ